MLTCPDSRSTQRHCSARTSLRRAPVASPIRTAIVWLTEDTPLTYERPNALPLSSMRRSLSASSRYAFSSDSSSRSSKREASCGVSDRLSGSFAFGESTLLQGLRVAYP